MGLDQILDIQETQRPNQQGELERTFRVVFSTEETSGTFTEDIPAADFSPQVARDRVRDRAEEIDSTFGDGPTG